MNAADLPVRLLFPPPKGFDIIEASKLVWELINEHDMLTVTANGVSVNTDAVGKKLREIFLDHYTVVDSAALKANPELAAWVTDVADALFPGAQVLTNPSTDEDQAAGEKILAFCNNWTSLALSSPLNRMVKGDGYYVVEQMVPKKRPVPGQASGVGVPAMGRFLTEDYSLLRDLRLGTDLKKFDSAARQLEKSLEDHGDRQPAYRLAIAKFAQPKVSASMAQLTHGNPKEMAALEAPEDPEGTDE